MSRTIELTTETRAETREIQVSVVIPLLNERESLLLLYERLREVLDQLRINYEILFVDDGSTDGSGEEIKKLARDDPRVRGIHFTRNFGKAAALTAGFRNARGDVLITMDADLQDDPREVARFLTKLEEGYDVVSGWKATRRDPWTRIVPSKLFNGLVQLTTGLRLHDLNCGFKAYRKQAAASLRLYGDLYRFIPLLVHIQGYRVTEIPVTHWPRRFGRSKFGFRRLHRGFFDLLTVLFLAWYRKRPLHLFGSLGVGGITIGGAVCTYLLVLWLLGDRPIGDRPLLLLGVLLVVVGIQVLTFGLLADMINASLYRGDDLYVIRNREGFGRV